MGTVFMTFTYPAATCAKPGPRSAVTESVLRGDLGAWQVGTTGIQEFRWAGGGPFHDHSMDFSPALPRWRLHAIGRGIPEVTPCTPL
jgi:hypothetical protein